MTASHWMNNWSSWFIVGDPYFFSMWPIMDHSFVMKSLLLGCVNKLTIPLTDKERTWVRSPLINKLKNKNHNISIDVGKNLEKFQHLGSLLVQWLRVHLAWEGRKSSSWHPQQLLQVSGAGEVCRILRSQPQKLPPNLISTVSLLFFYLLLTSSKS